MDSAETARAFAVPDLTGQPASEPVDEVQSVVGRLLVSRGDRVIGSVLRSCGEWEPFETAFLRAVLGPGQTFVDVGAHVGYFSVLASKLVGPSGRVIALEPEPRNLDLLRRNLAWNDCRNAIVVPFAAHSTRGMMSLALDERNRGGHHLVPPGATGVTVPCVRLDDLVPDTVDVLKVDAQGHDHEVIAGAERTIAGNPGMIVMTELSNRELARRGVNPESVLAGYRALGFTISTFGTRGELRTMSAELIPPRGPVKDISLVLERPAVPSLELTDPRSRPRRTAGLVVNETPDGLIVSQPFRDRVHYLNQTAGVVFDLCTGENPVAEIIGAVQAIYERPDPPVDEVEDCLRRLSAERLVV
jgi:FkbM family methyltransferase